MQRDEHLAPVGQPGSPPAAPPCLSPVPLSRTACRSTHRYTKSRSTKLRSCYSAASWCCHPSFTRATLLADGGSFLEQPSQRQLEVAQCQPVHVQLPRMSLTSGARRANSGSSALSNRSSSPAPAAAAPSPCRRVRSDLPRLAVEPLHYSIRVRLRRGDDRRPAQELSDLVLKPCIHCSMCARTSFPCPASTHLTGACRS